MSQRMTTKASRQRISQTTRKLVLAKTDGVCAYCGAAGPRITIDHVKPVEHGGTNDLENLLAACYACNNFKNVFTLEQFRTELEMQVRRARQYSVNFRTAERFSLVCEIERPVVFYFERKP